MPHLHRTTLLCQLVLALLYYRLSFGFQNEESRRRLIRMRRTLVFLVHLIMELLIAFSLALLLE